MTSEGACERPPGGRVGDLVLRPVRAGNAFEETVERLLQAIKLGMVAPGERLPPERELAAQLDVSRVTLREAIRSLQRAGIIQSRRGRYGGSFVLEPPAGTGPHALRLFTWPDVDQLDDRLAMRRVLEVGAAEAAATRAITEEEHAQLEDCLCAVTEADPANFRRLDSRFHLAIAELAGAPSLTAAVADIRMQVNELLDAIPVLDSNIDHSHRQHAAIVTAVIDGDPDRARQRMGEHLTATEALLRGFLT